MRLILETIKALFRKVENGVRTSIFTLSAKVTTAQTNASNALKNAAAAKRTADKAANDISMLSGTVPQYVWCDSMGVDSFVITPATETKFDVDEYRYGIEEFPEKRKSLIANMPLGSVICAWFSAYGNGGKSFVEQVVLTKIRHDRVIGGTWVHFPAKKDTPQYYDIELRSDGTAIITRYF